MYIPFINSVLGISNRF